MFNAEDRFWARFQTDADADAFGAQWAAFARAALFPTLAAGLDGGMRIPLAAGAGQARQEVNESFGTPPQWVTGDEGG